MMSRIRAEHCTYWHLLARRDVDDDDDDDDDGDDDDDDDDDKVKLDTGKMKACYGDQCYKPFSYR